MKLFHRQRRSITLLALLAMLALAVAPTVSRALGLVRGAPTVLDLCAGEGKGAKLHGPLDACALCVVAAHAAGPVSMGVRVEAPRTAYALPLLPYAAAPVLVAWHAAQPRAPPLPA